MLAKKKQFRKAKSIHHVLAAINRKNLQLQPFNFSNFILLIPLCLGFLEPSPLSSFCLQATASDSIISFSMLIRERKPSHCWPMQLPRTSFNLFIFEKDHSPLQFDIAMDRLMRTAIWTFGNPIHETFRNASVIKSTNMTTPARLTRPIQCPPVGGRASGIPLHVHIHPNDVFWVNKIFFKKYFQKNHQLSISDSRPTYTKLTKGAARGGLKGFKSPPLAIRILMFIFLVNHQHCKSRSGVLQNVLRQYHKA